METNSTSGEEHMETDKPHNEVDVPLAHTTAQTSDNQLPLIERRHESDSPTANNGSGDQKLETQGQEDTLDFKTLDTEDSKASSTEDQDLINNKTADVTENNYQISDPAKASTLSHAKDMNRDDYKDAPADSTNGEEVACYDKSGRYKCPTCSRIMKDKRLIANHNCHKEAEEEKVKIIIMQDSTTKAFTCKECEFTSTGKTFEEHLMCHLIIRPYQCLYCKECFINRKEICRHVQKSHSGFKMSCALIALRRAKALIKEVTALGLISFMAKVPGKVPLEKDPDKKKTEVAQSTEGKIKSSTVDSSGETDKTVINETQVNDNIQINNTESINACEKENQQLVNETKIDESEANNENNHSTDESMETNKPLDNKDDDKENGNDEAHTQLKKNPCQEDSPAPVFSKLRQVLTGEVVSSQSITEMLASKESNSGSSETGLKIVASYSLQEKEIADHDSAAIEPNFIMEPLDDNKQEPEVLSFLGPEQPLYKHESSGSLMLPPPPLQPAPTHLGNAMVQPQPSKSMNFFICGFNCLFNCLSATEFKEHCMNFHSSETFFPCYYCGHRSPNENDLVRHISNHTQTHNKSSPLYVCGNDGCRFGTNMVSDYVNHIKVTHAEILEPLCYACGVTFQDITLLQSHVEENVIHCINCPHCPSKATERRCILDHISSAHPGKAKMVSVAKQLICNDRKVNNYDHIKQLRDMLPPALTPAPGITANGSQRMSVVDQILSRHEGAKSSGNSLSEILSSRSRDSTSPSSPSSKRNSENPKSPSSEGSDFGTLRIKDEIEDEFDEEEGCGGTDEATTAYTIDENGIRRRIYVPMSERQAENYRCRYCTFIARDLKRLNCHERSHGMPPTRKERFKCMFCPQGFDSEMKFRLHITCHPGLIKFLLYRCKKCEFDTNQKHTIVKHITCNRDRKHRGFGPVEEQFTVISRSLESRVLECERCDYMTRHKIHMAIHYQRKHNILRDKGEFTIESLTPTDTPVSSYDLSPLDLSTSHPSPDKFDSKFDFAKPASSTKRSREKVSPDTPHLSSSQINERNELFNKMVSQQAALQPGQVLENQMRKFKCPICKYLLPKAADLKNHVKRHSEIGQITLVMFRCKYCSCMSTARELLYEHLNEKHLGKPIALVKKIVAIDTTEVDKSFAETSMEESLDQLEESLHKEIMTNLKKPGTSTNRSPKSGSSSYEQLFVIPEGGETFSAALQCPKCSFKSYNKSEIVQHVNSLHPEIKVIKSDEDVDNLAQATTEDLQQSSSGSGDSLYPTKQSSTYQEEVLIVPDDQVFKEPALCSRCDFNTMLRKDMVIHLQKNHPDISVMGRNSYPVQVSTMARRSGLIDESCVVGSGSLDAKIRCLYENYGTQMKCLICGSERPKKFFIHVHILRHLNIYLWKCAFCSHRGLQKYKMVDHIKKIHPGKAMSVRYIRVNVEAKVSQFLSQFNFIKNKKAELEEGIEGTSSLEDSMDQASNDSLWSKRSPGSGSILGGDELDEKISCMYDFSDGMFYKCIACSNQFQRKFSVHRHIIITHLKVALLACGYCGLEGVEKHQMVDHILARHKSSPVSIQTLDVDLSAKVSDFLAKLAAGELSICNDQSDQDMFTGVMKNSNYNNDFKSFKSLPGPKSKKLLASKLSKYKNSTLKIGGKLSASSSKKPGSGVDPEVIMLGREALDRELSSLYQLLPSSHIRCLVCRWEFPRKYPLHRHILLKHLKLNLVQCPYCPFEGVEKYTVTAHIKEEHKDMPISIKYTQPDVRSRVKEFVNDMANLGSSGKSLIQRPGSRDSSPLVVPKLEQKDEDDEDDDNADNSTAPRRGLVVAMFGKKKQPDEQTNDIVVKTEVDDDDEADKDDTSVNEMEEEGDGEEEYQEEYDEDNYNEEEDNDESQNPSKFSPAFSSYRSPAGGKPKALDVITKIKVLKAKEGSITKFYCEQCKFTSLHRSNIVRHIYKIHEKYQTHTCPVCNYQTLSLMLMQQHVKRDHPGVIYNGDSFNASPPSVKPRSKPLMGPLSFKKKRQKLMGKALAPSSAGGGNGQGVKQYACAYCHYETNTQEDILKHTRLNHHPGSSPTMSLSEEASSAKACWDLSKKAVKRKVMDNDGDSQYKRKKRFVFEKGDDLIQCGHCDTKETSLSKMQEHIKWDHPGLQYNAKRIPAWRFICKSCSVKTMATSKMKYHLNRHVNYRPYTCTNCGAFFPSPDQCRRHSRSQGHEEQYTYVRNYKKELKVEELLEGTRKLALQIQDEASKDPTFDISQTDAFIAKFQDTSTNLKRSAPIGGKKSRKPKFLIPTEDGIIEENTVPRRTVQFGKSPQTVGVELDVTVKCYRCEFTASNVSDVKVHHNASHPDERFLWTELDRGFTCDSTGEALPDCESVPSSSLDVGYTTRMTLGAGNSPMRFKCKTCEFSSCVIQAMKSHLKSHQPKGFICPYCSRAFSGKEKLMRHQYCLHKGQPLWVIHLRRAGVVGSTGLGKGKGKASLLEKALTEIKPEPELSDKESSFLGKQMSLNQKKVTVYNCSHCSHSTESLYHYRLHIAEEHEEFPYKVREDSPNTFMCALCFAQINTEELLLHIEMHSNSIVYQCGYCDFTHADQSVVSCHIGSVHENMEPRMTELELDSKDKVKELITREMRESPLLLNLSPVVVIEKIPDAILHQWEEYPGGDESVEEIDGSTEADLASDVQSHDFEEGDYKMESDEDDGDSEGRLMVDECDPNIDSNENIEHDDAPNEEAANSDEDADEISRMNGSESDMMIIQFGGMGSSGLQEYGDQKMLTETSASLRRKDSTLLAAQQDDDDDNMEMNNDESEVIEEEDDDDDDDLDEVNFENDITLASPLPMISLGDGVSMSPMSNLVKNDHSSSTSPDHPELLLDV